MGDNGELAPRIAQYLHDRPDVAEKAIFGGRGYLWRGHLVCGVLGADLLVRIGKERFAELVTKPGARPMTMGGRASRAWIVVDGAHVLDDASLHTWLDAAIDFATTLPGQ